MSDLRMVLVAFGVAGVTVSGIASSVVASEMVDEVNRKLPEREQFSPVGWCFPKTARLLSEDARLYPISGLRKRRRTIIIVGAVCIVAAGLSLGIW